MLIYHIVGKDVLGHLASQKLRIEEFRRSKYILKKKQTKKRKPRKGDRSSASFILHLFMQHSYLNLRALNNLIKTSVLNSNITMEITSEMCVIVF